MNVLYDSGNDVYYIVSKQTIEHTKPARLKKLAPVDPQLASNIVQHFDTMCQPNDYLNVRIGSGLYTVRIPEVEKWYLAKLTKPDTI